jgi:hypothetical protein
VRAAEGQVLAGLAVDVENVSVRRILAMVPACRGDDHH